MFSTGTRPSVQLRKLTFSQNKLKKSLISVFGQDQTPPVTTSDQPVLQLCDVNQVQTPNELFSFFSWDAGPHQSATTC